MTIVYAVEISGEGLMYLVDTPERAREELEKWGKIINWYEGSYGSWGQGYWCDYTRIEDEPDLIVNITAYKVLGID